MNKICSVKNKDSYMSLVFVHGFCKNTGSMKQIPWQKQYLPQSTYQINSYSDFLVISFFFLCHTIIKCLFVVIVDVHDRQFYLLRMNLSVAAMTKAITSVAKRFGIINNNNKRPARRKTRESVAKSSRRCRTLLTLFHFLLLSVCIFCSPIFAERMKK